MKLTWAVKRFDEPHVYHLVYVPDYKERDGKIIEKIDAHTGEVTYIETGMIKTG
ncbi:hypothetical protein J2S00_002157 [Caldalkalibacillus uzonensis]|uniref:PepSY domain-containing protein n=1 Tax=Caldalkalibacillus uzonensis TaxID=353224 RepID=A0ABU0CSH3_9BACI|nr:hypothetical protein [Caldalkalibacillus uzonensis]MDQ0339370.1 hypothetical protein [Caldalkalibacillus uzonensis]